MISKSRIKRQNWKIKKNRLKYYLKKRNVSNLPRLVVFRSNNNIFLQLLDDLNNKTILSSSSIDKNLQKSISSSKNKIEKSIVVGSDIADKIKKAKINRIIFDRNGYKYHGRVKAVGDAIRKEKIQI